MIYIHLLFTFIKVGLFSFGGGYAMIPLIQKEIESNGWITSSEFIDMIAIAEMTPGPIAVNAATFVGYKVAGIFGGAVATFGVTIPSMLMILVVSNYFFKSQRHPLKVLIFYGIRPVITAMIITAAFFVAETTVFNHEVSFETIRQIFINPLKEINIGSLAISILTLVALVKFKLDPILIIIGSGAIGVLLFYVI